MIFAKNERTIDINGNLFSAAGIHLFQLYPCEWYEAWYDDEYALPFGIYFEIPLENGNWLEVSQEYSAMPDGQWCGAPFDHYIVQMTNLADHNGKATLEFHCSTEHELVSLIRREMRMNALPLTA